MAIFTPSPVISKPPRATVKLALKCQDFKPWAQGERLVQFKADSMPQHEHRFFKLEVNDLVLIL